MCTLLLPQGFNRIAINKYVYISININVEERQECVDKMRSQLEGTAFYSHGGSLATSQCEKSASWKGISQLWAKIGFDICFFMITEKNNSSNIAHLSTTT